MNNQTAQTASGAGSSTRVLVSLAAAVVVLAGMWFARDLIGPLAIAAVIVIICNPLRRPLDRWGWPSWIATTAVILLSWAVLISLALMLAYAGIEFTNLVADYYDEMHGMLNDVVAWLAQFGLDQSIGQALTSVFTPSAIINLVTHLGSGTMAVLTACFFIFAYAIFMAADASRFRTAPQAYGAEARPAWQRFVDFNSSVRRYYVVNAAFGLVVAVIDGLALWWLGVPAPMVWAILAFVTNFIPNVGFVLGVIPPMFLALVTGGWQMMIAVVVIYSVVNVVLQVLVQPKFVSDAVNLSLTLSFLSVLFWTFIVGPLGAILSIPLTLLMRALILEGDPDRRWLRWLSGDDSAAGAGVPDPERPIDAPALADSRNGD